MPTEKEKQAMRLEFNLYEHYQREKQKLLLALNDADRELIRLKAKIIDGEPALSPESVPTTLSVLTGYEAAMREIAECDKCKLCEDHLPERAKDQKS